MYNAQVIQSRWGSIRDRVKERWSKLSDADLDLGNGNIDHLVSWIQKRTGEARGVIEDYLTELATRRLARRGLEYVHGVVRQRPFEIVAGSFGIGVVIGLAVGFACSRR